MEVVELLSLAHQAGIRFWVQEGALKYKAPAGAFTDELKSQITANKLNIIEFLQNREQEEKFSEPIGKTERSEGLPVSYGQKWLWLTSQMDGGSSAFHIPAAFRIRGKLNMDILVKSLNRIVERHEILRTVYETKNGGVYQRILPKQEVLLPVEEMPGAGEEDVLERIEQELSAPIDLTAGPVFRAKIFRLKEEENVFVTVFHHIVCDNQSMNIFMSELMTLYTAYAEEREESGVLPSLTVQYADYAAWQEERLKNGLKEVQVSYWREALKGIEEVPEICGDFPRPDIITSRSIREHYMLPEELAQACKSIGTRYGCSFYVTLLAVFKVLLFQYSGITDIITGSPVAGRGRDELQPLIGLFFNTVVNRTQVCPDARFSEFMQSVREAAAGAFANQDVPFELLADELGVQKQPNRTPVFQVLFNMYEAHYKGNLPGASLEVFNEDLIGGQNMNSKFDITLLAVEFEDGIQMDFSFKADLYEEKTVHWLTAHYKKLTEIIARNPEIRIVDLPKPEPIPRETVRINHDFIPVKKEDTESTIPARFDIQALRYPDKAAVESAEETLTYRELKEISDSLSAVLQDKSGCYPKLTKAEKIRYGRQLLLDGWGVEAQEKLKGLTVFAAGAGGSGSPVIMQLALLGVGTIIICDFDTVELSNLNRQALHDESRIGMNKAESAALTVQKMNPNVKTVVIQEKIDDENIMRLVGDSAVIFDNVDSIEAKFAISKCAVAKKIPHVISSMIELSSYAAIFHTPYTPCFHCCYDYEKLKTVRQFRKEDSGFEKMANSVASPSLFLSAGFAVNEAIKVVLGFKNPAYNKYFFFNNQASEGLPRMRGYQIVTYPFSEHFFRTCKKNGFDWEKGFSGRFVEEIEMERDLDCPVCGPVCREAELLPEEERKFTWKPSLQEAGGSGEQPETVALLMRHSANMVAGILGVLRSGAAFVPMDPEYPEERLAYILEDTGAHSIVCDEANEALSKKVREMVNRNIRIINLDAVRKQGSSCSRPADVEKTPAPESLAYILYTSGSMGTPKGVMQTHRNVLHYIMNYTNGLHISHEDRLSLIPSFIFSAAMMDVFAALVNGASLCLYDFKKEGPDKLANWIGRNKISVYHSVPTVFRHFTAAIEDGADLSSLRVIDFGGEAVSMTDVRLFHKYFPENCILVNGLGATELNVIRQYIIDQNTVFTGSTVPVGYPVEETDIRLIDEAGRPLFYNQPGEIVIDCPYLSPGYWGLEEQTKEAFWQEHEDPRIRSFHTGDLGRIRPDGCMEYLGRRDLQMKVRGIRIEPAEIEARLLEIEGIREAVVTVKEGENGSRNLAAYLVAKEKPSPDKIRAALKEKLPAYMIPSYFIPLEQMPLTVTGKINRKALPDITAGEQVRTESEEPENDTQRLLVSIWKNVLGIEKPGILDNFIDLGGDSIKAIKINAELIGQGYAVKVQDIIETQNIKELSERVTAVNQNQEEQKNERERMEQGFCAPLTATQADYFSFNHRKELQVWNISTFLFKKDGFEEALLKKALDEIVLHHDALRVVFPLIEGKRMQYCRSIHEQKLYGYYSYDLTEEENCRERMSAEADKIQKLNDLEHGPLMQCAYFKTKDSDYLLISIYHMLCDYISTEILFQDFWSAYTQLEKGSKVTLPAKTASFMQWSERMREAAFSEAMAGRMDYWLNIAQAPVTIIPTDYDCKERLLRDTVELTGKMPAERLGCLQDRYGVSLEVIILAILGRSIKKKFGIPLIRVEFAVNGRTGDYGGLDVSRTVGWFATSFSILIDSGDDRLEVNLQDMKINRSQVPGNVTDYLVLREITLPEKYPEYDMHTAKEVYVNFFGTRSLADLSSQAGNQFGVSDIPVGNNMSQDADAGHKFYFVISITDGELIVTLQYVRTEYKRETAQGLLDTYFEELENSLRQ